MNFGHIKNIHFVGIGGIGMSGIAEILTKYDLVISGCDAKQSGTTERVSRSGIRVTIGHDAAHVEGSDLIVVSSAVRDDNPEVIEARGRHVPVVRRAEMLGEIMRLKRGIAIAGTHGKTTTSAMTAMVLAEGGLDPTLIIGGVLRDLDTNARLGGGDFLVVEADEYDRSFLALSPEIAVVTNVEADHLDCYADLDEIENAFGEFIRRVPFYGVVIGWGDDPLVSRLLDKAAKGSVRYGFSAGSDLAVEEVEHTEQGSKARLSMEGRQLGELMLRVPGRHNILNALAAIAVGLFVGIPFETAASALAKFTGVERRFQILGETGGALIVDDYAHHPTEISATLSAARGSHPNRRIVALFQPHLYSRTRDFAEDFAASLASADVSYVSDIYGAREEPIGGVTSGVIVERARAAGLTNIEHVGGGTNELAGFVRSILRPGDLFVTMGAGDINRVAAMLMEREA